MTLSIILPIYNVEQYLRKCVDSVLNQDIPSSEYEIILVDDGSPDSCPQICDEYAAKHENIRVVHRKNGGLSAARNSGIEVAKGDYVMFIDSDDYIEPNVLKGLIAQMDCDKLDVLRYDYQNVNDQYKVFNPNKRDHHLDNDYIDTITDGVFFLNFRMSTACYAWQFVLKRELLDECIFTPGIYFEDTDWTPRMLCKAKRVSSANTIVYNYLIRQGSITNAVNRSKQQKVLDDKMRLIREMQRQADELAQKGLGNAWFNRMIANTVISVIGMLSTIFYTENEEYLKRLCELKVFPIAMKSFKARLINLSPSLTVKLLHLKNGK